jgi:hypothetical protein
MNLKKLNALKTPVGYSKIEGRGWVAFVADKRAHFYCVCYKDARWKYIFNSNEQRDKHIADTIENEKHLIERELAELETKEKPHTLKAGSILVAAWGYDQTNIDYYKVISATARRVIAVNLKNEILRSDECGGGVVVPSEEAQGEAITRAVGGDNVVKIDSYIFAAPWDGKPKVETYTG